MRTACVIGLIISLVLAPLSYAQHGGGHMGGGFFGRGTFSSGHYFSSRSYVRASFAKIMLVALITCRALLTVVS
jgi:hypothetical protein